MHIFSLTISTYNLKYGENFSKISHFAWAKTMQVAQNLRETHKIYLKEGRGHSMEKNIFKIESEEYIVKNLRLKKALVEQGAKIAQTKNISFNKFVNIALEFAITHYEED